jgi:aspartate aminotransferase
MEKHPLSERISKLAESQTLSMAKLSRELSAKGFDVINLSLGEPDFITPAHIREAAKKAIDEGYTHYTPTSGYLDLRKIIAQKLKRENGLDYTPDQVVVSTGAKQSIANVILSLINPGDEVILPLPYWVSYIQIIHLAEGVAVPVTTTLETDYKMSPEQLEAAITPRTKLLVFSSPCNPTGTVYSRSELEAFAKVLSRHPHVFVLSDEIYEHINFAGGHESIAQFDPVRDRVILVNGLSKGYAMTGWRLGYIAAPAWIAAACEKMQGQVTSGTSSISQKAAEAALSMDNTPTRDMQAAFRRRRDLVLELMRKIPGWKVNEPQGAFYVFPDISAFFGKSDGKQVIRTATDFCMYLLHEVHVSLVTGEAFGAPNCVRLSYAASEEKLREALRRIGEACARLSG